MAPVLNFRRVSEQFDPQTIAIMTLTHNRVCDVLGVRDKPFTREVVAAEIIARVSRYGSDFRQTLQRRGQSAQGQVAWHGFDSRRDERPVKHGRTPSLTTGAAIPIWATHSGARLTAYLKAKRT